MNVTDLRVVRSCTGASEMFEAGVDGKLEAGTYLVETLEELIEGLSFVAFRRVLTTIVIAGKGYGGAARQVVTIDPRDLEAAQELDADIEVSTGPLAHLVAR